MKIASKSISKEYFIEDNEVKKVTVINLITNKKIEASAPDEFTVNLVRKRLFSDSIVKIGMQDCKLTDAVNKDGFIELKFVYCGEFGNWNFIYTDKIDGNVIKSRLEFDGDSDLQVDSVDYYSYRIDSDSFAWCRPIGNSVSTIPYYLTQLGQPVFYNTFFTGVEFVAADNRIHNGSLSLRIYIGRTLKELKADKYKCRNAVIGSSIGESMTAHKTSFFEYVSTFARPKRFRIQFNSWYDNMLDIDHENLEEMFRKAYNGFKSHGLRDIDCYVVDDGWVDYKNGDFWAFNDKFKDGFAREKALTEEFNSTFGIWFGPRGGYSEAAQYAAKLQKNGYPANQRAQEICCGVPEYVNALTDKMIEFMKKYNATYFKIDGFAKRPCRNKRHGHPVGGYQDLYFYTYQWELWSKAFEKLRAVNPDVFLNITSHSNTSPWALQYADAVWLNNANDMYYEGEGGNLDQCLNYRDGRYQDLGLVRQLQFPNAYLYNHEPCYASRNYNPPLPNKSHKTVVYDDKEFEQYLYMCMMRGTGFIELYYSPSMMNDSKWDINTKVLQWAENNFDILSESIYFGGVPKNGDVYGYSAYKDGIGILAIRNPKSKRQSYTFDLSEYTHNDKDFEFNTFYNNGKGVKTTKNGNKLTFELEPFAMSIFNIRYK